MHQVDYALSKHLAGYYLLNSYKKVKNFCNVLHTQVVIYVKEETKEC